MIRISTTPPATPSGHLWAAVAGVVVDGACSLAGEAPSADVSDVIGEVATILAEPSDPLLLVLDD